MKRIIPITTLIGLAIFFVLPACQKSLSVDRAQVDPGTNDTVKSVIQTDTAAKAQVPFPTSEATSCSYIPNYGDTIVFPQPTSGADYIVSPLNTPPSGKFYSWPQGMLIDSVTGAINVSRSETGLKYAIGFVKDGSHDTCLTQLVIGGANYLDSVYVLENGSTAALPYFDANTLLPSVCANGGCTFDVTGSAARQKVIINTLTGVIDLNQTLNGGLLGGAFGLLPLNGSTVTSTIYYRLNDASNNALQHIDVQFVYYYSKSQIGQGLLTNILSKLLNALSGNMVSTMANPRPPLIVIVRRP